MPASKSNDKSSDSKTRKIIDVTEPGKTAPPETSRPIIVSSRPILRRDPMMASPDGMEKEEPPEEKPVVRTTKAELKINPLTPEEKPAEPATPVTAPVVAAPLTGLKPSAAVPKAAATPNVVPESTTTEQDIVEDEETPIKPAQEPDFMLETPAATADTKPANVPTPSPATVPVAPPAPASTPSPVAASPAPVADDDEEDTDGQLAPNQVVDVAKRKEEDEKTARVAEQEKIIESKQYFLPISALEKRRGLERVVLLLVIVIMLALVWLDVTLDAGIIRLGGIHSLTHFFKT